MMIPPFLGGLKLWVPLIITNKGSRSKKYLKVQEVPKDQGSWGGGQTHTQTRKHTHNTMTGPGLGAGPSENQQQPHPQKFPGLLLHYPQ